MSPGAFGHTGFTGTSLWIDPLRDLYVVLLTNRVHPSRPTDSQDGLARLRPQVHEAVIAALED
jgi:CubicO group peptidase (beta-lactamase class C family)